MIELEYDEKIAKGASNVPFLDYAFKDERKKISIESYSNSFKITLTIGKQGGKHEKTSQR